LQDKDFPHAENKNIVIILYIIILVTTILLNVFPSLLFLLPFPFSIRFAQSAVVLFFLLKFCSVDSWIGTELSCIIHAFLDSYFQDDDSDIDCELESFPPTSGESTLEPSACVKVNILIVTFYLNILKLCS
jgi:hypothetical protein